MLCGLAYRNFRISEHSFGGIGSREIVMHVHLNGQSGGFVPLSCAPNDIPSLLLRRLHVSLEPAVVEETSIDHHHYLLRLGVLLRQWRIRNQLTRQRVASEIGLDVAHFACLEHGLVQDEDVETSHLLALQLCISSGEKDYELKVVLQEVLAMRS